MKNRLTLPVLFIAGLLMATGCNSGEKTKPTSASQEPEKAKAPVELTMVPYYLSLSDEDFDEFIVKPVRAKYPHITMKLDRTEPEKLAAANIVPDLFYTANSRYSTFVDMDIPYDMKEEIKASKLDMNKFAKPNIDWVKELGSKGEVYGLPFDINQYALFYNKDLFDKRGVPYPKDGLTWDELLELSKKLTYQDGSVQYRGLVVNTPEQLARIRSIAFVDPQTNKALIDNPANKAVLELIQGFYQVPGMIVNNEFPMKTADFVKDGTVAMTLNWITDLATSIGKNNPNMNFDLVGAPAFKDLPNTTIDGGPKMIGISKTSKHKDDAFKVLQLLVSPEVQSVINRKGRLTALADENIRKDFASDLPILKGKNVQAALKVKQAKMAPSNPYTAIVVSKFNGVAKDLALRTKDINTILREVQEASDKAIQDELNKKSK
ncbi:ABC transporter substrate-binding protein [Paenibacillus hodogayensis]|uniref:ABC transporter substrate-binding protein n=1 Tax=Paenibacillus hodogayensis TaxID=279208 RepID=A0ABV5VYF2_9BACL